MYLTSFSSFLFLSFPLINLHLSWDSHIFVCCLFLFQQYYTSLTFPFFLPIFCLSVSFTSFFSFNIFCLFELIFYDVRYFLQWILFQHRRDYLVFFLFVCYLRVVFFILCGYRLLLV